MRTFVVINPASGGGRTGRAARAIAEAIARRSGETAVALTGKPGDATDLARRAIEGGFESIVAVGGDGTANEVVNGFFRDGRAINPEASLSLVTSGTGGDFRRTLGLEAGVERAIERLTAATPKRVDVGRVRFVDPQGRPAERLFLNIASFGLSGEVMERVNRARITKRLGSRVAFGWNSVRAILALRAPAVRLKAFDASDAGVIDEEIAVAQAAICNGRYFGGGMMIAPDALPDDGLFDVVVIAGVTRREMIARLDELYKGAHVKDPKVRVFRAARVIAAPAAGGGRPIRMEIDGEGGAILPATFEIAPKALKIRY